MARHRHRFWEDEDGQRLVLDNRGYVHLERDVHLGHHGGASPSAFSGTSYVYVPTIPSSPSPRRHRHRRGRRRRRRHHSPSSSDLSTSDSSGSYYRRGWPPGGESGPFPDSGFGGFPGGGYGPLGGPFAIPGPPSDEGSEERPPLLGEMFPGGSGPGQGGELTQTFAERGRLNKGKERQVETGDDELD